MLGGDDRPCELEIGPGRGGFIFERLAEEPELRIVGLEVRRKWATIVDRRLRERGLADRARVFAEDARVVAGRLASGSVSRAYIHFPDPWWKKRHAKRLVLGPEMAQALAAALASGGELFVQTDVEERAHAYEALLRATEGLRPAGEGGRVGDAWLSASPFEAMSPRERRAVGDGIPIYRLRFRRHGA